MHHKTFVFCSAAALIALAVGCSQSPETPSAPSTVPENGSPAAPDGSTLKVPAPNPVSPVGNAQPDTLTLTAARVTGRFNSSINPSYQFEIRTTSGTALAACTATVPPGSGGSVSYTPTCSLEFDTPHTWRVRAVMAGAVGPWSADASFRSPAGGYIRGNEIFDPLTNGRTVGNAIGTAFTPQGIELLSHESHVTYELPENLQAGEFSVMVTGFDEGSPGDKTKIMSMQEGGGDITTNDYRFTIEKRGRSYCCSPGAVTFRIITGGGEHEIRDGARINVAFSDELWYFWRVTWSNGRAGVEVKEGGPNGRTIYDVSTGTSGHPYRPVPHMVHLGAPVGRAGPIDASIPGAIYKNLWVSSRPRPAFPGE